MNDLDLTIERIIRAPRERVWEAWSNPDHLRHWWTPAPWRTEIVAFDLRPGGEFHIRMHGPDGSENDLPCLFLEVEPGRRVAFTTCLRGGWRPATPWMPLSAVFTLDDAGPDTDYRVLVMHKDAEDRARHEEMGFQDGWGTVVTQLETYAAAMG